MASNATRSESVTKLLTSNQTSVLHLSGVACIINYGTFGMLVFYFLNPDELHTSYDDHLNLSKVKEYCFDRPTKTDL